MDDATHIIELQRRVLAIFLILDGRQTHEYQRALMISLHLWHWFEKSDHPAWHVFSQNPSAFNEESGEICFSVLAREIASCGVRSDCETVSQKFGLIKTKITVADDLKVDLMGDDFADRKRPSVDEKGEDVRSAVTFFKRMIRDLCRGTHRHYDSKCGHLDQTARRRKSARVTIPAAFVTKLDFDVRPKFDRVRQKCEEALNRFWVYEHADVWPGAMGGDAELAGGSGVESEPDSDGESSSTDDAVRDRKSGGPLARQVGRDRDGDAAGSRRGQALMGRVVAIPSWCFGEAWSMERHGTKAARNRARLHGDVEAKTADGNYACRMREFTDYVINLTPGQVARYLVPREMEGDVVDTPFVFPEVPSSSADEEMEVSKD